MASFDSNTLPSGLVQDIVQGLSPELSLYLADQICVVNAFGQPSEVSGTIRVEPQQEALADGENNSRRRPGDTPLKLDAQLETRSYDCDLYAAMMSINDHELRELNNGNYDVAARYTRRAAHKVYLDIEEELADILKGNGTSGDSDDTTTSAFSVPVDDYTDGSYDLIGEINDKIDLLPVRYGFDVILGHDVARALQQSPDLITLGMVSANSSNTVIALDQIEGIFQSVFGARRVYISTQTYQNAPSNYALSVADPLAGVFALSLPGNLHLVDFLGGFEAYTARDDTRRVDEFIGRRTIDIITAHASNTIACTSVLS